MLEQAESERGERDWSEKVTSIGLGMKRKDLGRHESGEVELRDVAAETPLSSISSALQLLAREASSWKSIHNSLAEKLHIGPCISYFVTLYAPSYPESMGHGHMKAVDLMGVAIGPLFMNGRLWNHM